MGASRAPGSDATAPPAHGEQDHGHGRPPLGSVSRDVRGTSWCWRRRPGRPGRRPSAAGPRLSMSAWGVSLSPGSDTGLGTGVPPPRAAAAAPEPLTPAGRLGGGCCAGGSAGRWRRATPRAHGGRRQGPEQLEVESGNTHEHSPGRSRSTRRGVRPPQQLRGQQAGMAADYRHSGSASTASVFIGVPLSAPRIRPRLFAAAARRTASRSRHPTRG